MRPDHDDTARPRIVDEREAQGAAALAVKL
jgi:hypothetical protein